MGRVEVFDVFVSYARADAAAVRPLVEALYTAGLSVFVDFEEIDEWASITRGVHDALACSRAMLVWYSAVYPTRRACQEELRLAVLAGRAAPAGERARVLVVNPELGVEHVRQLDLRDALIPGGPGTGVELEGAFCKP